MKKLLSVLLAALLAISMLSAAVFANAEDAAGTAYYIDAIDGSDETGDGLSPATAWKSVPVTECTLGAGDSVLFRRGGVYECTLTVQNSRGTADAPITITAYGEGDKPVLTTSARAEVLRLFDCSFVTVEDLEITAHSGGGIWIDALSAPSEGITLRDLTIHDIQNYKMTSRDNLSAGAVGARACVMVKGLPARTLYPVNGLTVTGCEMYDCGNGISLWGAYDQSLGSPWGGDEFADLAPAYNKDVLIEHTYFHDMDAEAIIIGICDGALMTHCRVIDCCQGEGVDEDGNVLFYNAAAWFWGSENSTIEYTEIAGQKNVGDGMTVDFDSMSNHCTYQYIYSHDNTRFICNCATTSPQKGNVVRYCLSVNDDRGRNKLAGGPGEKNMLFYNNTIIGSQRFDLENIYDSYFVNNIIVMKDGYRLNTDFNSYYKDGNVIADNCYYNCFSGVQAGAKFNTLPGFSGEDVSEPSSFTLSKDSPLIGAGYALEADDCAADFFGNEIESRNIGCYGGAGTDAKYQGENVFQKLIRYIRCLFAVLRNEIAGER
ncbi:MAG: hypothetical protein IJK23_04585 [Clostridia bacterium]|nr:hypothetical protein [Clostridia bacterium]